jgi:hypothetical protein
VSGILVVQLMVLLAALQRARKWIRNFWRATGLAYSDYEVATCGKQAHCALTCGRTGMCDLRLAETRNLHTNHIRLCKKISPLSQDGCLHHTHWTRNLYNGDGHHRQGNDMHRTDT